MAASGFTRLLSAVAFCVQLSTGLEETSLKQQTRLGCASALSSIRAVEVRPAGRGAACSRYGCSLQAAV